MNVASRRAGGFLVLGPCAEAAAPADALVWMAIVRRRR